MELWLEYIKERQDADAHVKDDGFITYTLGKDECLVQDMYVRKDLRGTGYAGELMDFVHDRAVEGKCEVLTARIDKMDRNCDHNLGFGKKYGFKVYEDRGRFIILSLDL